MARTKKPSAVEILFIGNSFTQRNDLPGMLAAMAAEANVLVRHELVCRGGASLRTHWNAGAAAKAIRTGKYDHVVLQEQSTLPVKNAGRMAENVRLFQEVIEQAGARTALYMTWARQHALETQQLITTAYNSIGKEIGAVVVPVGVVWQKCHAKHARPLLYDRDQSHPSLAGSYLASCVFLAALLEIDPTGIEAGGTALDGADKKLLRRVAWQHCRPR